MMYAFLQIHRLLNIDRKPPELYEWIAHVFGTHGSRRHKSRLLQSFDQATASASDFWPNNIQDLLINTSAPTLTTSQKARTLVSQNLWKSTFVDLSPDAT